MILDTNGFAAVAEGDSGLETILGKAAQVAIPVVVLGEYRYGISQSRDQAHYQQWLAEYLPKFRILDVDEQTAIFWPRPNRAKEGRNSIPSNDIWSCAASIFCPC